MRRNIHGKDFIISMLYQIFVAIGKNALIYFFKGNMRTFWAYLKALGWNLKNAFNPEIHNNPYL
jgi:hypothetical protein